MKNRKSIIISISGTILTKNEINLFKYENPWGVILFKRNIKTFKQIKKLILDIKKITKDVNYPVLIDEEGGTVSRLTEILDNRLYSQKFFADIYKKNKKLGVIFYTNYLFSMCNFLKLLGININSVPVLDILKKRTSSIIGTRSYSSDKNLINLMGSLCLEIYKECKVGTIIKHIPGHGSASLDSHKSTPVVNLSSKTLKKIDFGCFKNKRSFFAMTAHIIYSKLDSKNVATHSPYVINKIIRKEMKFKGILISDDISMKALKYDLITNAKKSLNAGCNLVLYCGGKYSESLKLLKKLPYADSFTSKKTSEFYKFLS